MAHYLFNFLTAEEAGASTLREQAAVRMRRGLWGIDADERHRAALAPGDLVLVYVGAPLRSFIGRAELASAAEESTSAGEAGYAVALAEVEAWDPPVPMSAVLARIPGDTARGDFEAGVVRITADEYETAVAVAAERSP